MPRLRAPAIAIAVVTIQLHSKITAQNISTHFALYDEMSKRRTRDANRSCNVPRTPKLSANSTTLTPTPNQTPFLQTQTSNINILYKKRDDMNVKTLPVIELIFTL